MLRNQVTAAVLLSIGLTTIGVSTAEAQTKGIIPKIFRANTGQMVRDLVTNDTLDLTSTPLTICLTFTQLKPKSVVFFWNGVRTLTQTKGPFCVSGRSETGLLPIVAADGIHSIRALLYSEKKGKGLQLGRKNFTFTIKRSGSPTTNGTLRAAARERRVDFGFAVTPGGLENGRYADLVKNEATMIGAENVLKPSYLLKQMNTLNPADWEWDWEGADKVLSFARTHGLKVRGHALFWHQSIPTHKDGVRGDFMALVRTPAQTVQFMRDYSRAVMERIEKKYPKLQVEWDVVNEAFKGCNGDCKNASDNEFRYREGSFWWNMLGKDWIRQGFLAADLARRAIGRADLKLVYNEFLDNRNACHLIGRLKQSGTPIDAVGFQTHIAQNPQSQASFEADFRACAAYGLKTRVTELDHVVDAPISPADEANQKRAYANLTRACLAVGTNCDQIVTWGLYDGQHPSVWESRNEAVKRGAPLLFDESFAKKAPYFEVLRALKGL